MAKTNDVISEGEQKLLDRTAKRLNISDAEYAKVLKNPEKFPVNPPVSYDESIERLYTLTKMIYADNEVDADEVLLLRKVATALSFPLDNIEKVCDEAIHLIMNDNDLDDFNTAIKKVNSI